MSDGDKPGEGKVVEPFIDDELVAHVCKVWDHFYKQMVGNGRFTSEQQKQHAERLAGYLTIAYFVVGGKMPLDQFDRFSGIWNNTVDVNGMKVTLKQQGEQE